MESSHLLNSLADASVRSLCLAAAATIAIAVARTRSAPVKHAVWTAVVCAMLAMPVLSAGLPAIPLRVLAPAAAPFEPLPGAVAAGQAAGPVTVVAVSEPPARLGWSVFAAFAYLIVAATLLGRFALGYLLSRRLVGQSAPVEGAPGGLPGAIVAESDAVSVPLTVGFRRPHILLPPGWREWDGAKLAAVMAHEAAHVARRDWLVAVLARLNTCVFWFHPLAWWMERKLAALAEEACDDSSLAATGDRERYAQVLLEMANAVRRADGRLAWHAVTMACRSQVRQRVEAILDESRRLSRGMTKARWAAVLLCAVPLAYGAAALRFEQTPAPAQIEAGAPWTSGGYLDTLSRGNRITLEEAQRLEGYLQANPDDLTARGALIAYYFLNAIREPRLKHICWLIEHHPESEITVFNSTGISPRGGILNSESDYAQARDLWLEQVRRHENDPRVLGNAARFFLQPGGDLGTAADLIKRAAQLKPDPALTQQLAGIYANAIIGALRPRSVRLVGLPDDPALAERFKAELESSTNGMLLILTGRRLIETAQREPSPELAAAIEFGERLVKRAAGYGYRITPPPPGAAIGRGGVELQRRNPAPPYSGVPGGVSGGIQGGTSGGVQGGVAQGAPGPTSIITLPPMPPPPNGRPPEVLRRVPPVYPPLAKQARIQGAVRLRAELGADGGLLSTAVVSGHPLLIPAAEEAVRQWTFKPAEAGGQPIRATITIEVNFTLPPLAAEPQITAAPARIRAGGNVLAANLLNKVEPVYPPLAAQARIQGTVRFNVTIGEDGHIKDIQLESGHPLLVPAAQEAVRQWTYRPTLLNGEPVEVLTRIDVPFTLQEPQ